MDRLTVARKLVKMARELVAFDWGRVGKMGTAWTTQRLKSVGGVTFPKDTMVEFKVEDGGASGVVVLVEDVLTRKKGEIPAERAKRLLRLEEEY